jgi:apolipoprotein N-acyltransferase
MSSGNYVISKSDNGEVVKVSLIQANILPDIKRENEVEERISTLRSMTLDAGSRGSELIVWAETSVPCYYRENSDCIRRIKNIVKEVGIPVVAGAPEYVYAHKRRDARRYNSAFLISGDGETAGKYRKIYLVQFGEHLPFDNTFPALRKVNLGQGDYSQGEEFTVLSLERFKFSVLICFESAYPRLARKFVKNGAELLVNITEDAWFGQTAGPYQHAEMAIVRAVENRASVARCGNSGISMLVDPYGRVLKSSKIFERTIVEGEVPLRQETSFYTKFGDLFALLIVAVSIVLFVFSFTPFFRRQSPPF